MATKRTDQDRAERYARQLLEAARSEDRSNQGFVQWQHATKFSPEVLDVLSEMRRSGDTSLIGEVAKEYKEILDSSEETVMVTATTAVEMDDQLREAIRKRMEAQLNAHIFLVERIDPSIIGGIVIEVRGNRYDASVRAQLANIRKVLSSVYFGSEY